MSSSNRLPSTRQKTTAQSPSPSNPSQQGAPPTTTKHSILDYLLYRSTQSRLRQADKELDLASVDHIQTDDDADEDLKKRRLRQIEELGKKGQGVEAIVDGLLQSHRAQAPMLSLPPTLKYRLYFCQLTNLVFGRFDEATSTLSTGTPQPMFSAFKRRLAHHHHQPPSEFVKYEQQYKNAISPPRCRRHRLRNCQHCHFPSQVFMTHSNSMGNRRGSLLIGPPPGLIDAIPAFLKTSASTYRVFQDRDEDVSASDDSESIVVLPKWYDLLLDLLTQAAIESYLCDSHTSLDALLEIFSYGDIDPSEYHSDSESESGEDDDDPILSASESNKADDYLLWQKTPALERFREKKSQRRDEFLKVKDTLESHFESLAIKYAQEDFETSMREYCKMVMNAMPIPDLEKYYKHGELPLEAFTSSGQHGISVPAFSGDGDESDDETVSRGVPGASETERLMKRRKVD